MGDPRPLFAARLERWLEDVKEGLGMHAGVSIAYGATSYEDMASLDERDIAALGVSFANQAGVAPLQVRRLVDKIPCMIGEARGDLETPITRQPASTSAGASRPTAHGAARQKTWQRAFEEDDEEQASDEDEDGEDGESGDGADSNDGEFDAASSALEDEMESERLAQVRITKRARSRTGDIRQQYGAAAAKGMAKVPSMLGKSSAPSGNKHGMGGQASADSATAGRVSPFRSSPFSSPGFGWRGAGDYCTLCCV